METAEPMESPSGAGADLQLLHRLCTHDEDSQARYFAELAAQLGPALAEAETIAQELEDLQGRYGPRLAELRQIKFSRLEALGAPHQPLMWARNALQELTDTFNNIVGLRRLRMRAEGLGDILKEQGKGAPERTVASIRSRAQLARCSPADVEAKMLALEGWVADLTKWAGKHTPAEGGH